MTPHISEDVLSISLLFLLAFRVPACLAQQKLKDLQNVVTDCTTVVRDVPGCDPSDLGACATSCAAIVGASEFAGLCRWDNFAGAANHTKGCLCPADAGTCSVGEGRSGCYWHVDKINNAASTCITNANRFHNILYYHLMKRGKKNFAINIRYGATPARGVLPQGPWGPAKIGFGSPEMQLYRARLRMQQQRVNHPGLMHGGFSFGQQNSPFGLPQNPFQPQPNPFGQPSFGPAPPQSFGPAPPQSFGPAPPQPFGPAAPQPFGPPQSFGPPPQPFGSPPHSHNGPMGPTGGPGVSGPEPPPQPASGEPQSGAPPPQAGVPPPQQFGSLPPPLINFGGAQPEPQVGPHWPPYHQWGYGR